MKMHIKIQSFRRTIPIALCVGLTLIVWQPNTAASGKAAAAIALVNAASYDVTVAPGSIAALFGSNMTAQAAASASTLPLPTSLAGLTVKINGIVAPLFFASASQINLQVPGGVSIGSATVEVFNAGGGTPIATGTSSVADSAPGVFTVDVSGHNQASALNSDFSYNAAFDRFPGSRPEASGNFVTIYATGIGATNPTVADGQGAPSPTFALATSPTTVIIGGAQAQVLFSGLAPGYVGLWQINAVLPVSLPTNLATPLRIELRTRQSVETTLAVANKNEFGNATGTIVSALTGAPITGAGVTLQATPGATLRTATTDALGHFTVSVIAPGGYNVAASATGYLTATQGVTISSGVNETLSPIALTAPLATGEYRVMVTWQSVTPTLDLDLHLTGPTSGGARYHVWWNGETDASSPVTARLDRDDLSGAGPETITFTPLQASTYRLSVHNYSDRDASGSIRLAGSKPIVRVFRGSQQVAVLMGPSGGGTLWKLFELTGDQLTVVNQLSDELEASNIKISY